MARVQNDSHTGTLDFTKKGFHLFDAKAVGARVKLDGTETIRLRPTDLIESGWQLIRIEPYASDKTPVLAYESGNSPIGRRIGRAWVFLIDGENDGLRNMTPSHVPKNLRHRRTRRVSRPANVAMDINHHGRKS